MLVNDLPMSLLNDYHVCAIDIETTGLEPRKHKPCLISYYSSRHGPYIVRLGDTIPVNVAYMLQTPAIQKIAHHAPFDLSFLYHHYGVYAQNVACTKVLARVLDPKKEVHKSHSLKGLVFDLLGIKLDKSLAVSDWTQEPTQEQINYALNDVFYLKTIHDILYIRLNEDKRALYHRACARLMVAAFLHVEGVLDLYGY